MKHYKRNKKIEVFWRDTVQDPRWQPDSEMDKEPDALCCTLGYYHHHDKHYLYLSHTIANKERDKTTIPLGCIVKTVTV